MARKEKMVTRTFDITDVTFMGINLETKQVETMTLSVPGKIDDHDAALVAVRKVNQNPKIVPSVVTSLDSREELYGMTESEFLKHSKKLPPRAKIDEESDNS